MFTGTRWVCAVMVSLAIPFLPGCKIEIAVPEGGHVETESGAYSCESGKICSIDVVDVFFKETFVALPDDGYTFIQWRNRYRGFCGGGDDPCYLSTDSFPNTPFEQFLESDEVFYLEPVFWQSKPWTQVGDDIEGNSGDFFGYSVSLSADGNRIAIGATGANPVCHSCNDDGPGYVRVYASSGTDWTQLGNDIVADRGAAVSFSADGRRVAIGEPGHSRMRVYRWTGTDWIQMGGDIVGEAGRFLGGSVSLSANGNRLAAGTEGDGRTRVYAWSGTAWKLLGDRFLGGRPVLSAAGNRVVCASVEPQDTPPTGEPDTLWVYEWNGTKWTRMGGDILGSKRSYSFSERGNRLAVIDSDGLNRARVLKWSGSAWTQLGADILPEGYSGDVVSISADGNRLALGALGDTVRIYTYSSQSDTWRQVSQVFIGNYFLALWGLPVSLSADGSRVAIGAPWSDLAETLGGASSPGRVRVWERPL